ncbi:MAG: exosome complex RNA-binding protein Csl4 [Methanocellales archaeon]|nr:exosome complex RNA-binding protein Csl4 [Methanocellales archaeon]MDD3292081.1 exosome complex RNA-binding protein Csl4 [Methanocellales archaeon]MDD5235538.1 exosome complex RNA-binding protein Csl4 [Methanocellales archaeon]MDD5485562.1 exosome complex RNA-binding protein Csl4 [Methanocellales archaeon]
MSKIKENFAIPGDFLGTSEEFLSMNGTYKDKGNIYAACTGVVKIDTKDRSISIVPQTCMPPVPKVGDIVIGRVSDIKSSVVLVDIARIKGQEDREIATLKQGAIHISNIKDAYVKELGYEFGFQDIVRAKVIDDKTLRLSTDNKSLGVIKAICSRCRVGLKRKDDKLECPKCGRIETRKIADDYGSGSI